ncbi:poly-gamma-glutamate synthesis protein precursor [Hydra vulgaris]|uniref:Poly-gamma-glutamate synthesis protein n=1 Tax=Hydra vulgaris TaxID=6087 RepID=Q6UDX2_HYDVU|nr:poly-gamma-glutamate synthesis protein precursor [Hydra vulgaris]AAQ74380.1 poly-gamma-glutamate synthesis protein [Hydra vulgaris]
MKVYINFVFLLLFIGKALLKEFEADIIFGGDISFDSPIRVASGSSCPYPEILKYVAKYFKNADFNMINLEAPFVLKQNENLTFFPNKGIHNKAWPESVEALTSAGIKSVTLANNHISDYGGDSVDLTTKILFYNKIDYVGITYGESPPYSPQKPLIKEINGIKVGFLGYCGDETGECEMFRAGVKTSTALLRKQTVEYDLQQLKSKVDIIVTFLHWGTEYFAIPKETQRNLAIYLSQLGVNLIIGSHPHVMQGHEWLNNTLVHYSLGNLVFHPHFTFMGTLAGQNNSKEIHAKATELSRQSRGPASYTELFKVQLTKTGIKSAYFLPVRIFGDKNGCIQPKPKVEDNWIEVCGPQDDNCYVPRPGSPQY